MRHSATRPYKTSVLLAVFIVLCSATVLYARPANRINSIDVNPRDVVTPKMPMVVSNPSPFQPTSLCNQCHVRQADEWSESYHYLAWRDPVFQAFYSQYLDYLSVPGRPGVLPASIYTAGRQGQPARDRQGNLVDGTSMTVVEQAAPTVEKSPNAAYQGRTPSRSIEDAVENLDEELDTRLSVVTPLEPIGEIRHGDGLLAEGVVNGKVQMNCLRCHAPGADITLDVEMRLENNTGGVFCDYCHTVVDRTDHEGYILIPSHFKQGPYATGLAASHVIEFSRLQTQSEFCKSCHQMTNPQGVPVYNTYNEWFDSTYAQSVNETTCQSCHMQAMPGKSAIQGDDRLEVYSHKFPGAHDRAFLYKAATVDVVANVDGSNLFVDCTVTNQKVGHNFPADTPLRELVLVVRLKGPNGETLWQGKRVYSRIWGDAAGNITYAPWEASQILADTSLRANEQRSENFQIPLPQVDGQMYVTAQLFFRELPEDVRQIGVENIPQPYRIDHATAFLP